MSHDKKFQPKVETEGASGVKEPPAGGDGAVAIGEVTGGMQQNIEMGRATAAGVEESAEGGDEGECSHA